MPTPAFGDVVQLVPGRVRDLPRLVRGRDPHRALVRREAQPERARLAGAARDGRRERRGRVHAGLLGRRERRRARRSTTAWAPAARSPDSSPRRPSASSSLFLTEPVQYLPKAVLGAVIVFAAIGLVEPAAWRALAAVDRVEVAIAGVTTGCVVVFGVLEAIVVAVGLSIIDTVRRSARAHDAVLGWVERLGRYGDVSRAPVGEGHAGHRRLPARRPAVLRQRALRQGPDPRGGARRADADVVARLRRGRGDARRHDRASRRSRTSRTTSAATGSRSSSRTCAAGSASSSTTPDWSTRSGRSASTRRCAPPSRAASASRTAGTPDARSGVEVASPDRRSRSCATVSSSHSPASRSRPGSPPPRSPPGRASARRRPQRAPSSPTRPRSRATRRRSPSARPPSAEALRQVSIPGKWGIPRVTFNADVGGLSHDGRLLVLQTTDFGQPLRAKSGFVTVDTRKLARRPHDQPQRRLRLRRASRRTAARST